jgi:hypothetical protein
MIDHFMGIAVLSWVVPLRRGEAVQRCSMLESVNRFYVAYATHCPERREPSQIEDHTTRCQTRLEPSTAHGPVPEVIPYKPAPRPGTRCGGLPPYRGNIAARPGSAITERLHAFLRKMHAGEARTVY